MARARDDDFIERLYDIEYERLYKAAYRKTKKHEYAQDLVQETFVLAIFHQEMLMQHKNPGAWLMLTLYNLAANWQRSQAGRTVPLDDVLEIPAKDSGMPVGDLLPAQLPDGERQILIWRFQQQMSYEEMAQRLGVSQAVCRKRVSLAIQKCRRYLKE